MLAFGLDHVILRDIDAGNPASTRSLGGYSLAQGKTTLVAEAGRSGLVLDADVDALVNGCLNVLGALKMMTRAGEAGRAAGLFVTGGSRVAADGPGMFYRHGEARHDREGGRRCSGTRPTTSAAGPARSRRPSRG